MAGLIASVGCAGSRWAKADPKYDRKYHEHTNDPTRVVKQAVDARHVAGRVGSYTQIAGGEDPAAGEMAVGRFRYPKGLAGTVETRGGLRGLIVESGGWAAGAELGIRLQAPSRIAPFVGVGGFLGAAPQDYLNEFAEEPYGTTLAAAVSPEVGVHLWLTPAWRLSASATQTFIDFEGPASGEYTTVGLTLACLEVPGLRRRTQENQPLSVCTTTIPPAVMLASPTPLLPEALDSTSEASPYAQLLDEPETD